MSNKDQKKKKTEKRSASNNNIKTTKILKVIMDS